MSSDCPSPNCGEEEQKEFRRTVKTYVLRAGRMTDCEKRSFEELNQVWCIPYQQQNINYTEIFNNTNPVIMEIGFGMGHATVEIAKNNPDVNYIGTEVHVPGVGRLLNEIKKNNLNNLYIINHDALEVMENMIRENSLNGFHIFFPDPWPKKKHHKRRLLTRPRTDLIASKLCDDGYIYFATDWEEYAYWALEELSKTPGIKNKYEGFAPHQEWRPRTKFEQKGLDAGRQIYEIVFVKDNSK